MKKILIISNVSGGLYKFRGELIKKLTKNCQVEIMATDSGCVDELKETGAVYHEISVERHGVNIFRELKLIYSYMKRMREFKPDIVLTYTIKPNIYAGIVCSFLKIPYLANITGLGTAIENPGLLKRLLLTFYKFGLRKAQKVFFQNIDNMNFFLNHAVIKTPYSLLPGSGVNLEHHCYEEYPEDTDKMVLLVIGRLMRDKGTDEVLFAAEKIKKEYPEITFKLIGHCEDAYKEKVENAVSKGYVEYVGPQSDVHSFIKNSHATVHASYHEGMANVLLETAACGRPVVATDVPGCRETFDDGISGISCKPRDADDFARAVKELIELPYEKKKAMGIAGRRKMEQSFSRDIIISEYMEEINKV